MVTNLVQKLIFTCAESLFVYLKQDLYNAWNLWSIDEILDGSKNKNCNDSIPKFIQVINENSWLLTDALFLNLFKFDFVIMFDHKTREANLFVLSLRIARKESWLSIYDVL